MQSSRLDNQLSRVVKTVMSFYCMKLFRLGKPWETVFGFNEPQNLLPVQQVFGITLALLFMANAKWSKWLWKSLLGETTERVMMSAFTLVQSEAAEKQPLLEVSGERWDEAAGQMPFCGGQNSQHRTSAGGLVSTCHSLSGSWGLDFNTLRLLLGSRENISWLTKS